MVVYNRRRIGGADTELTGEFVDGFFDYSYAELERRYRFSRIHALLRHDEPAHKSHRSECHIVYSVDASCSRHHLLLDGGEP